MQTPDPVRLVAPDALPHGTGSEVERLLIRVSTGVGTAPTRLAAFDAALTTAGVAGYNLVRLSSVIPPYATVRRVPGSEQITGAVGDVAYCVYAAAYASTPGEQAWAGVAWAFHADRLGGGLFVEHTAASESLLRRDLGATVEAMAATRRHRYRRGEQTVCSAVCVDQPVCAVVVATYGTTGWSHLLNSKG